jgi:hypothetical protein
MKMKNCIGVLSSTARRASPPLRRPGTGKGQFAPQVKWQARPGRRLSGGR